MSSFLTTAAIGIMTWTACLAATEVKPSDVIRGAFDMSTQPRPYVVYLTLDQEGVPHPSFWAGRNHEGTPVFRAGQDVLTGQLELNHQNPWMMRVTNAPNKRGNEHMMPMGHLMGSLSDDMFIISIDSIRDARHTETRGITLSTSASGGDPVSHQAMIIEAVASGSVMVNDTSTKWQGPIRMSWPITYPTFSFSINFTFKGSAFGLSGAHGGEIKAVLYAASTTTLDVPGTEGGDSGMLDDAIDLDMMDEFGF